MEVRPFDIFFCFVYQFSILGTMGDVRTKVIAGDPHHSPVWRSMAKDVANVGKSMDYVAGIKACPKEPTLWILARRSKRMSRMWASQWDKDSALQYNAHRFANFAHAPWQSQQLNSFITLYRNSFGHVMLITNFRQCRHHVMPISFSSPAPPKNQGFFVHEKIQHSAYIYVSQ